MKIVQVSTPKELKKFIQLPYRLYRGHPHWVPPLRGEVRAQFDIKKNPFLEHCDYQLFLLLDRGRIVGRVAAFIDSVANNYWNEPVGLFGYYECPNDLQASALLLDSASEWLKARGMRSMRGPWSFVSQEWGAVVEGFEPAPVILAPFNPPYYIDHFNTYGFHKIKDLLVYVIDARENYRIPERILTLTDRVSERYGIRTRPLDMQQYDREVASFLDLSNQSLADNWGYAPVTPAEAAAMAKDLKSVLHPKAVIFAEDREGRAVGFGLALPDVNQLLKGINGRLLPVGWFKLLTGLPKLTHYRMFALGVIPEYQGKAIDSLIYRALYESIFSPDLRMEINYVLEDNAPMNNAIIKLGARPLRRYRIFEKAIN